MMWMMTPHLHLEDVAATFLPLASPAGASCRCHDMILLAVRHSRSECCVQERLQSGVSR